MKLDFWTVLKYSRLMKIGLVALLGGVGLAMYGALDAMPARSELTKVSGDLTEAKKLTKISKRRRSGSETRTVVYELGLNQPGGAIRKLSVGERYITQPQVEALFDKRIDAEVDAEDNIYVLSGGGRAILTYEKSQADFASSHNNMKMMGSGIAALGLPVGLLGFFWKRRTPRKAIAAHMAAQQAAPQSA